MPPSNSHAQSHTLPIPTPGRQDASPYQSSAAATALRGASLAFQNRQRAPSAQEVSASSPANGALLAATTASREASHSRPSSPSRTGNPRNRSPRTSPRTGPSHEGIGKNNTGDGGRDRSRERELARHVSQILSSPVSVGSPHLLMPPNSGKAMATGSGRAVEPKSASFIAATLAASRSASPTPSPGPSTGQVSGFFVQTGQSPRVRRDSPGIISADSSNQGLELPDTTSIPATNSLISMFEGKGDIDPVKKSPSAARRPALRAPTPPRELSPSPKSRVEEVLAQRESAPTITKPKPKPKPPPKTQGRPTTPLPTVASTSRANTEIVSPKPRHVQRVSSITASSPPAIKMMKEVEGFPFRPTASTTTRPTQASSEGWNGESRATKQPVTEPNAIEQRPTTATSASSDDSFVSASSTQTPQPPSPTRGRVTRSRQSPSMKAVKLASPGRPSSDQSNRSLAPRRPAATSTPSSLALDSLTNAIVASSLASSRHPTPRSKTPPPVPASRRHHHHHHLPHPHKRSHSSGKMSKSPRRSGMLQTLRSPPTKSDDEGESNAAQAARRRHKNPLSVGNKHSHHEGARRRWRDEVTPRERKRYEAVWASNRGLFLSDEEGSEEADCVCNVVVRDLWSRSRLPADELAEVWELVDGTGRGMLTKSEFVVGMWLIDQRLRGRKIPPRVSESVWASVRGWKVRAPEKVKGSGKTKKK